MYKILNSQIKDDSNNEISCYQKIQENEVANHFEMVKNVVETGLKQEYYDKRVAKALVPKEPKAGKLYGLVKDHKEIPYSSKIPPLRPVVSGWGTNTEMISSILDTSIKPIVKKWNLI